MISNKEIKLSRSATKPCLDQTSSAIKKIIHSFLNNPNANSFSQSCSAFSAIFKDDLKERAMRQLLQAVIDDDIKTVSGMLNKNPELLLIEPSEVKVNEVECKQTWLKIKTEKPFVMAQKLQRVEMIKMIYPLFDEIKPVMDRKEIMKQLMNPMAYDLELQKSYIKTHFEPLNKSISQDECTAMLPWRKETLSELNKFRETLLPDKAIHMSVYFDIEQMLIAAYRSYLRYYYDFKNDDQRVVYFIQIIGFIQSLVDPDLANSYCHNLSLVNMNKDISTGSYEKSFKMKDGTPYYRVSRESAAGLGYNFFCTSECSIVNHAYLQTLSTADNALFHKIFGRPSHADLWPLTKGGCEKQLEDLEQYVKQKREKLDYLYRHMHFNENNSNNTMTRNPP